MLLSSATDGFRLGYARNRKGDKSVVLLHGWPGDHTDFRKVAPLLTDRFDVVAPDLRGFGSSDKHAVEPGEGYSAAAQARGIAALIDELALHQPVLAGYDVGSRVAQTVAREYPDLVSALVLSPPLPGIGDRVLNVAAQREFWYQAFHQLPLAEELIADRPDAVRAYLRHFWNHWSGPQFTIGEADLDHLADIYAAGRFHRVHRLVPRRRGHRRHLDRRTSAAPARSHHHTHRGAVAGTRPALPP